MKNFNDEDQLFFDNRCEFRHIEMLSYVCHLVKYKTDNLVIGKSYVEDSHSV